MRSNCDETATRLRCTSVFIGLALALMLFAPVASAQAPATEQRATEPKATTNEYQTFYLRSGGQQRELNDVVTDLRNMLPKAKVFLVTTQNAVSIQGSAEDFALAQKVLSDIDRPRKMYRLTYTITEMDGGKRVGAEHFVLIVAAGARTTLKQGSRVPFVTGMYDADKPTQGTQVQYQDVGLSIEASLDGESLHTKVEQSSTAEEKSSAGLQAPIVHQTLLDGMSNLMADKPLVLGSLDIPGSTRHKEIEVASELVR